MGSIEKNKLADFILLQKDNWRLVKPILLENLYIKVNKNNLDQKLRYNDGGNVHMDFHGATNTTIEFIINKYGIDTMNDIFKKVGNDVYKDIKDHIKKGISKC